MFDESTLTKQQLVEHKLLYRLSTIPARRKHKTDEPIKGREQDQLRVEVLDAVTQQVMVDQTSIGNKIDNGVELVAKAVTEALGKERPKSPAELAKEVQQLRAKLEALNQSPDEEPGKRAPTDAEVTRLHDRFRALKMPILRSGRNGNTAKWVQRCEEILEQKEEANDALDEPDEPATIEMDDEQVVAVVRRN